MASLLDLINQRWQNNLNNSPIYNNNNANLQNQSQNITENQNQVQAQNSAETPTVGSLVSQQNEQQNQQPNLNNLFNQSLAKQNQNSQYTQMNPDIYNQYIQGLQEPKKKKGFLGGLLQTFKEHPSLLVNSIGGIMALTGGNGYMAGALGQTGNKMAEQENAMLAESSQKRQAERAAYVKSHEQAQQAYTLKGLELAEKQKEAENKYQQDLEKQGKEFAFKDKQKEEELKFKKDKQAQDLAMEKQRLDNDSKKLANEIKKTENGKILPAGTATGIGDIVSSVNMLDNLASKIGSIKGLTYSPADNIKGLDPWDTGAQNFKQIVASTKQVIGKGLEGGVLRKEDEYKYDKIIPKMGDTKEVLQVKYANLRDLLINKHSNTVNSLKQAGYNVENLKKDFGETKIINQSKQQNTQQMKVGQKIGKYTVVGIE
jgi:hypothetical protein